MAREELNKGLNSNNSGNKPGESGKFGDTKNSENEPSVTKHREFEMYHIWKKLPFFLKGKDMTTIRERFGFDEEEIIELLQIRTQEEFSKKYDLSRDTLTDWNRRIANLKDPFEGIRKQLFKVMHNVVWATYNSALKSDPRASADRKLALQFLGWVEKSENSIEVKGLAELLKENADYKRQAEHTESGDN